MAKTSTTTQGLRAAIERSGYYPALVAEAVEAAVGGEPDRVVPGPPGDDVRLQRGAPARHGPRPHRQPLHRQPHRRAGRRHHLPDAVRHHLHRVREARPDLVGRGQPGRRQPRVVHAGHAAPRGRPDHRLGRRLPHRPGARRLRRPQLRGGPRLHRQLHGRRPEPAGQRGRATARTPCARRSPSPRRSPRRPRPPRPRR